MADEQTPQTDTVTDRQDQRRRRRILAAAGGVVVLAASGLIGWFGYNYVDSDVKAELHSWEEPTDATLPATIDIRRPAGTALTCGLVAVDDRMVVVGQRDVDVPAGPEEHFKVTADIPLEGDGVIPELRGCRPVD